MNCRICNKEIGEGTVCAECLKNTDQELLTIEERRKKNEIIDNKETKTGCISLIIVAAIGVIFFSMGMVLVGIFIILVGVCAVLSRGSAPACPACQRRGTIQDISKQLVSTRETTKKVKKTVERVRKDGSYNAGTIPERYEIEDYIPAIEKTYQITYKCNKCGYLGHRTEQETVEK